MDAASGTPARIGVDLGGTKISATLLDADGRELARHRADTPRAYDATLAALAQAVGALESQAGSRVEMAGATVGIGLPGVVDSAAGTVRAVNLPWLEGRPFAEDAARALGRPVRIANDANTFVLSEAVDGAAAGASVVFGIILGTGVGGGIVVDRRILPGANALAGEWGHTPLPWRTPEDGPPEPCGCGRSGCVETLLSGSGLARLHARRTGEAIEPPEIAARAAAGDAAALGTLRHHADALARALAAVINLLDPDAIVVGGGLSGLPGLYESVPALWGRWALSPAPRTRFVRARHGADSGVRGAAWLWPTHS
ncbi:ROK family protein [Azospirillum rugosum]|uniref:Fructokinase n=1 Tax=Azospirillum rugosum TaxID=416170 RepID=A0ABS4SQF8_9PROT|nr:ROK family protein [Azospirillum rugosum]MBP2294795.1 fructokinase [Azospirillum rugosum]MDQ0528283.1 fructokinase [Azospirillum rugosum]